MDTIAVTGATGGLGSRVADRLARRGAQQRLVVRDLDRVPDALRVLVQQGSATLATGTYSDGAAMRAAFEGCDRVFMVSGREDQHRVDQHCTVVDAAVAAGVHHLVYTSFLGASPDATFTLVRQHFQTEEYIKRSGLTYTFLRDSLYLDFTPLMLWDDGMIRGPGGMGRVAAVARDDVADVAVEVLTDPGPHEGATYTLTGPVALTLAEIAAEVGRAYGRATGYEEETVAQAFASRSTYGAPDWIVEGWVTTYTAIAAGELDLVTDDVLRITGHPATSLPEYLAANPA
jgi:uncharacterized protein YbjT (DUF2867 family)